MAIHYLDASVFVKRYLREPGSRWINNLLDRSGQASFVSSELIIVEVVCALGRAERAGRIDSRQREKVVDLVLDESSSVLDSVPVSAGILRGAIQLASRHPLRAYDAVHLATALDLAAELASVGLSAPRFVCADTLLLSAARAEGLTIENPDDYA